MDVIHVAKPQDELKHDELLVRDVSQLEGKGGNDFVATDARPSSLDRVYLQPVLEIDDGAPRRWEHTRDAGEQYHQQHAVATHGIGRNRAHTGFDTERCVFVPADWDLFVS